jgi:hypothetical protein
LARRTARAHTALSCPLRRLIQVSSPKNNIVRRLGKLPAKHPWITQANKPVKLDFGPVIGLELTLLRMI